MNKESNIAMEKNIWHVEKELCSCCFYPKKIHPQQIWIEIEKKAGTIQLRLLVPTICRVHSGAAGPALSGVCARRDPDYRLRVDGRRRCSCRRGAGAIDDNKRQTIHGRPWWRDQQGRVCAHQRRLPQLGHPCEHEPPATPTTRPNAQLHLSATHVRIPAPAVGVLQPFHGNITSWCWRVVAGEKLD